MQRISTSFGHLSDLSVEQKTEYIIEQMTDNAFFPNPVPELTDVQASLTSYSNALVEAGGLDRTLVALKNEARQVLEIMIGKLGMYVMNVALGNVAMLTSSGFTLLKSGEPQYIDNPGQVTISNGITSGELVAVVPAVKGAKSYMHQIATELPTDATEWVSTTTSRSKFTYTNLQAGRQYWIRVAVIGSRGQVAYSPVSTQFAQ